MKWLSKWINLALSQMWLLVAGAFGVLVIAVKWMVKRNSTLKKKNQTLETEVQRAERIQDVQISTNRDDALRRLHSRGSVRKD